MKLLLWAPAALMAVGTILTIAAHDQASLPLRAPLGSSVPAEIASFRGRDITVSEEERRVAGMSEYVMRAYAPAAGAAAAGFSVYVGYYASQTRGKTIHSPKNCLPGAGWEALTSRKAMVASAAGPAEVNRYLLQRGKERALVLYWYQGRGRIAAGEYRVKWDLLRDAALRGRSDEALVRVIVPVTGSEEDAFRLAARVAGELVPAVGRALPA
ncbi:MAG TPA: EpsI family protein [Longimicrobium sp.]|jgi:EpsI family protein